MKYKLKYKPSKWDINNQLQKFYGVPIITEEVSSNNIYSNFKIKILRDENYVNYMNIAKKFAKNVKY